MRKLTIPVALALVVGLMFVVWGTILAGGPTTLVVNDDAEGNVKEPAPCDQAPDFPTITLAEAASHPGGSTILVCPGNYQENVVIDVTDLTLQGISGRKQPVVDGGGSESAIKIIADSVTVDNLKVTGGQAAGGKAGIRIESDDNTITGNTITSNGRAGIFVDGGDGNTIRGNKISKSGVCGIVLNNADNNIVRRNHIKDSGSSGIRVQNGSDNNTFWLNTMTKGDASGVDLRDTSTGNAVEFNTAEKNKADGFKVRAPANGVNTFTSNKSVNNQGFGYNDNSDDGGGLITNTYLSDTCRKNKAGGSAPVALCGPQP